MEDLTPLQAFRRICNLRMLAGVYYFCLLYALSRSLTWFDAESARHFSDWLFALVRFSRQSLLTGLALLLAVALAEALLAGRRWPRPASRAVQAVAVVLGATLGTWLRYLAAVMDNAAMPIKAGWVISTVAIWALFGGMAYALLVVSRAQRAGRDQLTQLFREREALKAQQTEAQLSALNAQIEPHFLFNT
ncbi:MAG: hypothetical protein EOP35_25290, partial [Rubrivivax sp.]